MSAVFRSSLQRLLKREIRDWRNSNQTVADIAWPWYQSALVFAGEKPVKYPAAIACIVLALSGGAVALPNYLSTDTEHVRTTFQSIWSIQASLVGVVYPIVIGFISLLLQRRHSPKSSLTVYLQYSAAIVTGLSALLLVLVMSVQSLLFDRVSETTQYFWFSLSLCWFVLNTAGVIRFLALTFEFLNPVRRASITKSFAANYLWPKQLQDALEHHIYMTAVHTGILPGVPYSSKEHEGEPRILLGWVGRDLGSPQVSRTPPKDSTISEVQFGFLSIAIRSWLSRQTTVEGGATPTLIFPSAPGDIYSADAGLCRVENGTSLSLLEKVLVLGSFAFTAHKEHRRLSVDDVLSDLITDMLVAMENREETVFVEVMRETMDLHSLVLDAGEFWNDEGNLDNFCNLIDHTHFFERRLAEVWVREYRRLVEATVERLDTTTTYFQNTIHISGGLLGRTNQKSPRLVVPIFDILQLHHYFLTLWWSRNVEKHGFEDHSSVSPTTLPLPEFGIHLQSIKEYIGAWGSIPAANLSLTSSSTWREFCEYSESYEQHLERSATMLFRSVSIGDKEGAEWMCDFLVKWWSRLQYSFDRTHMIVADEDLLNLEILSLEWVEASKDIEVLFGLDEATGPREIWAIAIQNYWVDVCCLAAYAAHETTRTSANNLEFVSLIAQSLISATPLREGDEMYGDFGVTKADDLILILLRQLNVRGGYISGYRSRLDRIVEQLVAQGGDSWVPGRMYGRTGADDLASLGFGILVNLLLVADDNWVPSQNLTGTIKKWGTKNDAGLRDFISRISSWREYLLNDEFREQFKSHYEASGKTNFDEVYDKVSDGLSILLESLEDYRTDALRDAPVDPNRLREIGLWASGKAFSPQSGIPPINLFKTVRGVNQELPPHSVTVKDSRKGYVTSPLMDQLPVNQDTWFEKLLHHRVANSVLRELLGELDMKTIEIQSSRDHWEQIKIAANHISNQNKSPVLLVASRADPRWLIDWTREYGPDVEKPTDIRFTQAEGIHHDHYLFDINNVPVFVAPVSSGYSFMFPREVLEDLSFTQYGDDEFVTVSYEDTENPALIDLSLTWRMRISVEPDVCFRFKEVDGDT